MTTEVCKKGDSIWKKIIFFTCKFKIVKNLHMKIISLLIICFLGLTPAYAFFDDLKKELKNAATELERELGNISNQTSPAATSPAATSPAATSPVALSPSIQKIDPEALKKEAYSAYMLNGLSNLLDSYHSQFDVLKAKAKKSGKLNFKGFYLEMPGQDFCALHAIYMEKDSGWIQKFIDEPESEVSIYLPYDGELYDITQKYKKNDRDWPSKGSYGWFEFVNKGARRYDNKNHPAELRIIWDSHSTIKTRIKSIDNDKVMEMEFSNGYINTMFGAKSWSADKFSEAFQSNVVAKDLGGAWSSLVDYNLEMETFGDYDFNLGMVVENYRYWHTWENSRDGYKLQLHNESKWLRLKVIAKDSDISFD